MLVEECDELDAKIAWKLAETNNQRESLGDLNEHITLLRQASKHSKKAEHYDAQAQEIEDNKIHLLTVARQVLVFNEENQSPVSLQGNLEKKLKTRLVILLYKLH